MNRTKIAKNHLDMPGGKTLKEDNHRMVSPWRLGLLLSFLLLFLAAAGKTGNAASPVQGPPVTEKVEAIIAKVGPELDRELAVRGFRRGAPLFIRIFKLPGELEVWLGKNARYELFKTYPICDFSGFPGPKLREGDWQSPEGFYSVAADQMHPQSDYHLAFNIGYPNEYDRLHRRSGGSIMVHGSCSSMGCFAMSDFRMEEIYTLAHEALANGQQSFGVHIFPFRMTSENMNKFRFSPWIDFWKNLKEGFDAFELTGQVPEIGAAEDRYVIGSPSRLAMRNRKQ